MSTQPASWHPDATLDPVPDAPNGTGRHPDSGRLVKRVAALSRFVDAASRHVDPADLEPVRALVARVDRRLALSPEHTVVALAGTTGSGKSSLFNALTATTASAVGVLRPTTDGVVAATPDPTAVAGLLDWLDVAQQRRVAGGEPGILLLDLPDFDSVAEQHRHEVDRLLRVVDLVVWVTDPQKYADRSLHGDYLRALTRHAATTVVAFNQVDRLEPAEADRCLDDLVRLLADDGYPQVPVLAVSATSAEPGVAALTATLRRTARRRTAALLRLAADTDAAIAGVRHLVGPRAANPGSDRNLVAALADAAGVPAVSRAVADAYRIKARAATGWPVIRWLWRLRADPLRRLRAGAALAVGSTSALPWSAAGAVADLAIRDLCDRASAGLARPWPDAIARAARSQQRQLVAALDSATTAATVPPGRKLWWRLVGGLQWLLVGIATAGALWLLVRVVLLVLGLGRLSSPTVDLEGVGPVPDATVALIGGALCGLSVAALVRPLVALGAHRARRRARTRMERAIAVLADNLVLAPVREVLADYRAARQALHEAAAGPDPGR
jgi:GTP-binding protein EngB required for normal cell division